jgi:hypothetical protein
MMVHAGAIFVSIRLDNVKVENAVNRRVLGVYRRAKTNMYLL